MDVNMTGTGTMSGETVMLLPDTLYTGHEYDTEYATVSISPVEELEAAESALTEANEAGADSRQSELMLEECRDLARMERWDEYNETLIHLFRYCEQAVRFTGGRLKPVGDYLDFFPD